MEATEAAVETTTDSTTEGATQVVVIGAGPGGYAAAFQAADLGLETVLVDASPRPGGVCLHAGCIPSKALLHVAKLINEAREASAWGVRFQEPKIDLAALRRHKEGIIHKLASGIEELARRRRVRLIRARATFADSHSLSLEPVENEKNDTPRSLSFENAIIAVGSAAAMPAMFRIDDPRVMDSTGALALEEIPASLLVVGGGYIGLEMATVYAALGSRVTVVELTDGLLPGADRDLVRPLEARLKKTLAAIHLNTKVASVEATKDGIRARLETGTSSEDMTFDRVLVAVGRRPNGHGLGLESTAVDVDERGFIPVDSHQRTREPHIYAIGDVAGEPMLAHKASREAKVAAEVIAGEPAAFDSIAIPAVVFTDPEIAWCGLTERQAKEEGIEIEVAKFPWAASGRAIALDLKEGLTKLILEPGTGRVLGAGIVGSGAGELIAEAALAVEMAAVGRDLAETIHAHPTLSETLMEAAEVSIGASTHVFRANR